MLSSTRGIARAMDHPFSTPPGVSRSRLTLPFLLLVVLVYAAAVIVATFPAIRTAGTSLPGGFADPLAHLWTMRWHKQCLLEGRLPFVAPRLQYPVGAPLGYLPPLQYQSLLYVGLSSLISNDALCYNIIWFHSLLLTGVGTFVLAWYVLRDRLAATLAGLLGMIGGPMLIFAVGEIEQITLGWFPLFLVGWLRFVDRPSRGRLAAAVCLYLLLAMSAPYYGLFGVFPAVFYVLWKAWRDGWRGPERFLRTRLAWFTAFACLTFPVLLLLFSSQVWAMTHGYPMTRSDGEFLMYKATLWSYLIPTHPRILASWLPASVSSLLNDARYWAYIGVVPLALVPYAALARIRFPRASFWWISLAMLFLLSLGASVRLGTIEVPLPAMWLRVHLRVLQPVRVPGRFCFFTHVLIALISAAAFSHLLSHLRRYWSRGLLTTGILIIALIDLAQTPFHTIPLPGLPDSYKFIQRRDPHAAIFEAPHINVSWRMPALAMYWQSIHGLRTSAGYTADFNHVQENLLTHNSPFHVDRISNPDYLADPDKILFDPATSFGGLQPFDDFVWLYLTALDFDYLVLHHRPQDYPERTLHWDKVKQRLAPAKVFEDEEAAIYQTDRLPRPTHPVIMCTKGWRSHIQTRLGVGRIIDPVSHLAVYTPKAGAPVVLVLRAVTRAPSRTVELRERGTVLARWQISSGEHTLVSPPLLLAEGLHDLTLACDGVEPDASHVPQFEKEKAPFSLWVSALVLGEPAPVQIAGQASESSTH